MCHLNDNILPPGAAVPTVLQFSVVVGGPEVVVDLGVLGVVGVVVGLRVVVGLGVVVGVVVGLVVVVVVVVGVVVGVVVVVVGVVVVGRAVLGR